MRFKDKIKNKGFWVSLVSAVLMVLQAVGVKVNAPYVNELVTAALGVLVILGIISDPSSGSGYFDSNSSDEAKDDTTE